MKQAALAGRNGRSRLAQRWLFGALLALPLAARAEGGWTPLQLALTTEIQLFDQQRSVYGLRLDLGIGQNQTVAALDLGLANLTSGRGYGLQLGGFNAAEEQSVVAQLRAGGLRGQAAKHHLLLGSDP